MCVDNGVSGLDLSPKGWEVGLGGKSSDACLLKTVLHHALTRGCLTCKKERIHAANCVKRCKLLLENDLYREFE